MGARLAFMGTPEFALPTLERLIAEGHEIACVYTQPPRPAGRGMARRLSPVHRLAETHAIAVCVPASLKSPEAQAEFADLRCDATVVVAYGLLLPRAILDAPRRGCFNVHASLLPRWRGAAPIQRAVMAGERETGISIMRMEPGLDTGPVCRTGRIPIAPMDTAGEIHDRLARLGAELMADVLRDDPPCTAQAAEGVSYARKIDKAESRIDFSRDADSVRAHIHGLSPYPGAWFEFEPTGSVGRVLKVRLKVLRCMAVAGSGEPGTILDDALTIACGAGAVRLVTVQREGKAPMEAEAFLRGLRTR